MLTTWRQKSEENEAMGYLQDMIFMQYIKALIFSMQESSVHQSWCRGDGKGFDMD